MKRLLLVLALVLLGGAGVYLGVGRGRSAEEAAGVRTVHAALRTLESRVLATGTIRLKVGAEVKVGSRISGLLSKLNVTVGSHVSEGDVIAELDRTELEARVAQAEAAVAVEEESLANARRALERAGRLFEEGYGTRQTYEDARGGVDLAEARVRKARADLELQRVQLSYSIIRAPIGGVVASVSTQEGEAIAAGFSAPTFVTIIDEGALETVAFVDETDIGRVRVSQEARFHVDSFPDKEFEGRVLSISPKAVILSGVVNYEVRIGVKDPQKLLRPDMTTNITILTERREALSVPNQAVRREEGGRFVYVLVPGGFQRRSVRTGARSERYTEILEGLADGARVATGEVPPELILWEDEK
ncbi:MAG: efflux RND transporter periplasmic adaptor subunit [Acidobacteriota bacterium]